jgi:hypothetical protein
MMPLTRRFMLIFLPDRSQLLPGPFTYFFPIRPYTLNNIYSFVIYFLLELSR